MNRQGHVTRYACAKRNATGGTDGKTEQTTIRKPRGSLVDPFTQHCQIAIERTIIERTQFDLHRADIGHNRASKPEEWGKSPPGRMSIRSRKIPITDPHR